METFFQFELISLLIFSILSIYLDQVFPNEFGQKKHPLFFINWIWRKNNKSSYEAPKNDIEVKKTFCFQEIINKFTLYFLKIDA